MRVLVLGGTAFVGRAVVDACLSRGWTVSTFNRGRSGRDADGVETLHGDRTIPADVAGLATRSRWDAVVDTSGYVPQNVLGVATVLRPAADRYLFMSTVSVYAGWPVEPLSEASEVLYCPPDAGPDYGVDVEDGPTQYGYQKSGCEAAALQVFGEDLVTVLRPGVVLGPREYVGRLPWWLNRVAAGGEVVAPGSPRRSIQPVDVRDLANYAARCIADSIAGTFNVAGPGTETFGGLLRACADATGSSAEFVWVPDDVLAAHGVRQWSELPLWRTMPGVWKVDASRARASGLQVRPLTQTVRDTWAWLQATGSHGGHERAAEVGLTPEHEREILAAVS